MKEYAYLIWIAVAAALFAIAWRKGYLARLSNYVLETREELRKCTWPSIDELKGSTVVVVISTLILGLFTMGTDFLVSMLVRWVTQVQV